MVLNYTVDITIDAKKSTYNIAHVVTLIIRVNASNGVVNGSNRSSTLDFI